MLTSEQAKQIGSLGGKKTHEKYGSDHMRTIGKLGFARMVETKFNGDKKRAMKYLQRKALIAIDPMPHNGAWTNRNGLD